ncbi:hypothetical protein BHM03_00057899 [Ensete ventricosum]|nr:hypothetical protein BHM03_00057899 [Ensete ventricosum]
MRLNCVESFYALLLHFRRKGNEERGWPATARPPTGAAGYGQGQPAREAGGAYKGRQTPAACRRSLAGAVAHRGGACRQKRHPQGLPPAANRGARPWPVDKGAAPVEVPAARAITP